MDFKFLETQLIQSLEDGRLSPPEKYALRDIVAQCNESQRRFMQNTAFSLFRDYAMNKGAEEALSALKWLEKTIKVLNPPIVEASQPTAHFSPGNDCLNRIVSLCQTAKSSIDICVFTISDDRLTAAILQAHQRGVAVRVITDNDKSEDMGSDVDFLQKNDVPLKMDVSDYHMHHKFAVFDGVTLLNGSFNWTRSATTKNQENILVIQEPALVSAYVDKFHSLWQKY